MPGLRRHCERALGVAGRGAWVLSGRLVGGYEARRDESCWSEGVTVLPEELEQRPGIVYLMKTIPH